MRGLSSFPRHFGAARLYSLATSLFSEDSGKLYAAAVGFLLSGIYGVATPSKKIFLFDAVGVFVVGCLFLYMSGHYSGMALMKQMVILYWRRRLVMKTLYDGFVFLQCFRI